MHDEGVEGVSLLRGKCIKCLVMCCFIVCFADTAQGIET